MLAYNLQIFQPKGSKPSDIKTFQILLASRKPGTLAVSTIKRTLFLKIPASKPHEGTSSETVPLTTTFAKGSSCKFLQARLTDTALIWHWVFIQLTSLGSIRSSPPVWSHKKKLYKKIIFFSCEKSFFFIKIPSHFLVIFYTVYVKDNVLMLMVCQLTLSWVLFSEYIYVNIFLSFSNVWYYEYEYDQGHNIDIVLKRVSQLKFIFMQTAKTYEKCCKDRTFVADDNNFSVLNDLKQQN